MIKGTIFNIQQFSLHDGPGIRTTVFLKGCPLSCAWCQNPEGIKKEKELLYFPEKCLFCKDCVGVCPSKALTTEVQKILRDSRLCTTCGKCVEICPSGALEQAGEEITAAELLNEVLKDRLLFEESAGGVTLSGGEPLLQKDFCLDFLYLLRSSSIHTVIDTCGYVPWADLKEVAPLTDLFLYDLKLTDVDKSLAFTGVTNDLIMDKTNVFVIIPKNNNNIAGQE